MILHHIKICLISIKLLTYMQMSPTRPFPSSPGRLYQNEVKCSAFDMQMSYHSHAKNSFSQERLCNWPYFESEGFWNSEVVYSFVARGEGTPKK